MSFWKEYTLKNKFPKLEQNLEVDTLIIGGGMTGLHTFYYLKKTKGVVLVEANTIGLGVSANTTAKINYLQDNTYFNDWKSGKVEIGNKYLEKERQGIRLLIDVIAKEKIDCDLEQVNSYLVINDRKSEKDLNLFKECLEKNGIDVLTDISPLKEKFYKGIGVRDTYVFHPLKYMDQLVSKLPDSSIYEHTRIEKIEDMKDYYLCYTDQDYCIKAKKVILTCHYPFFLFPYMMPMKVSVEKSYLVSVPTEKNLKYTFITLDKPSLSSRFYGNNENVYQIFLGSSHDISCKLNDVSEFQNVLDEFAIDPQEVSKYWTNVDIISGDYKPFVGEIQPHMYLATGFCTWGMSGSVIAADMISRILNKEAVDDAYIFDPKRCSIKLKVSSIPHLLLNSVAFLKSYCFFKPWYSKSLSFSFKDGKFIASYKDQNGIHEVVPICPHMKCGLIFNEIEKTWDCPCHSSRFDIDGNWLKGPSKTSIGIRSDLTK